MSDQRDRPPTRYDEEGKSLPERGSYAPAEPERLFIPAEAVAYLLNLAVASQPGNAWWNGFVTAHGLPSWVVNGLWELETKDAAVIKTPPRINGAPRSR
jgi:hypothetical protein